jgi:creatinine amidohydrolase/Fe(II)-dependent formamide hydrolase-like protein
MRALVCLIALFLAGNLARAQAGSLFVEDLTWPEMRDAIAHGKTTAIYYAGSTEQNGPHMALAKHNVVARHVARRIAEQLGNALVYPILPFAPTGDRVRKTGHMRFPGSVSLSDATFAAVAREVAQSAIAAGFRDVVLMADHGDGQGALKQVAGELDRQWGAKGVHVHYIGDLYYKSLEQGRAYIASHGLPAGRHAAIQDTSELMYVDREQHWLRRDRLAAGDGSNGVDGDPRQASPELGKVFLGMKVDSAVAQIRSLVAPRK